MVAKETAKPIVSKFISLLYGSLSLSLSFDFSCHCRIGILGFLLGLLGLLLFGFVEVFVHFFFVWDFVAECTECLGFLLKFLGDGFVARTLYVCVIEIHFLCYWNSECVYGGVCFSLF